MKFNVLMITALFVFSVVSGICYGQNKVVVIPLMENEAIGDARTEDVLVGKTYSSDEGSGRVGTMPNHGVLSTQSLPWGSQVFPAGYYDGVVIPQAENLLSWNIIHGVTILNVVGTGQCLTEDARWDVLWDVDGNDGCNDYCFDTYTGAAYSACVDGCWKYYNSVKSGFDCH